MARSGLSRWQLRIPQQTPGASVGSVASSVPERSENNSDGTPIPVEATKSDVAAGRPTLDTIADRLRQLAA